MNGTIAMAPKGSGPTRVGMVDVGPVFRPTPMGKARPGGKKNIESGGNVLFFGKDVSGIAKVGLSNGSFG